MTTPWRSALALSTLLHALIVGAVLWFALNLVHEAPPKRDWMNLVLASSYPSPSAAVASAPQSEASTRAVHFSAPPKPKPTVEPPDETTPVPADNASAPLKSQIANPKAPAPTSAVRHVDVTGITSELRQAAHAPATDDAAALAYQALLEAHILAALEAVPGLDDGLRAEATFEVLPTGRLAHIALSQPSHNAPFDLAILESLAALDLPPPPSTYPRHQRVPITTRARH